MIANKILLFQASDESDLSTSEEGNVTCSKKKKKSRALREDDLSKEDKTRAEVISILTKKYECDTHSTPCYVQDNRHLQLNPARLQIWAREIVSYPKLIYFNNRIDLHHYNFR